MSNKKVPTQWSMISTLLENTQSTMKKMENEKGEKLGKDDVKFILNYLKDNVDNIKKY